MVKKILFISLALFGLVLSERAEVWFADTSALFEQAQIYKQDGNYEQAEQIYQQIVTDFPDSNDALEAQKQLALMYITTDSQQQADAAFVELTAVFAGHKDIAQAVWKIAKEYEEPKKYDKALELHQYNVEHFSSDMYAMWSQVEVTYFHINSGDNTAADAAFEKLLTLFSGRPTLPKEIHQIAMKYNSSEKREKALELYQYNVEHFSSDMYAMCSQVEIVYSLIDSGDAAAADAACNKLITVFSKQETLPKEIHQVAMKYSGSGQSEKAYSLHQYNVKHFPDYKGLDVIWSQSELIRLDLQAGFYESACAGAEALLGWPPDQNDLPREIHVTAKRFAEAGKHDKAYELYRYNIERFPKDMYAMWSQVEIVYSLIDSGDAAADRACDTLLNSFSDQESLPKEVYQVAEAYNKANRSDKTVDLCRYIVERWPSSDHALLAQRDLTIRSIDADDEFAAQSDVDKLLSDFCEHQSISQVIHAVAQHYERAKGNLEKALELHRYNVEHFSSDMYAMWSQVEIVNSHIRDGNDVAANAAFDKLMSAFSEQPTLPKEIYQVGDEYAKALNYDKAGALYQYVIANWPDTEYEMWARTGMVKLDIYCGNDANVQPALDQLIADFNDNPDLPEAVFVIGEQYYNQAFSDMNEGLAAEARENFRKTVAVWEKVIQQLPASAAYTPRFYYITAVVYSQELGQHAKGIEHYQHIVDNWPDYEFAWHAQYFVGMYYERLLKSGGIEVSEALPKIEQAYIAVVENYPDSKSAPHAALYLGRINFNRKQWVVAAYYFELFLQKSDNNQALRYVVSPLGQAYEKMGETDSAAQVYGEFIETADPNDPLVKTISARLAELTWTQN